MENPNALTKEQIIESVSDKYGITADRKKGFHPNVLAVFIEMGFNQIVFEVCKQAFAKNDYSVLDSYTKPYEAKIECNEKRNEWFCELPAPIIQLPMNRGIRLISPLQDRKINFIYRANGESEIYENISGYSETQTIPTWYVENEKIFFDHRMTKELAEAGVLIKLVVPFREWKDEDFLPLPSGQDFNIVQVVEQIINGKQKEQDRPTARPEAPEQPKK
jgi:hypothetical protein